MDVGQLSTLHMFSFTNPHLNLNETGDFCVYFTMETAGVETFVTDLTLFI